MADERWVEITDSQFAHEREGLEYIRRLLPSVAPFRAWTNFEFRETGGRWHEVDLLVLGRRRLHLVELKFYSGTLRGDDHLWRRDGHRVEDSPLKLARRKAQRLASRLQAGYLEWQRQHPHAPSDPREVLPFVQECVFLHHPSLRCELPPSSRRDLFGLNEATTHSGLPGISERLLEPPDPYQPKADPNKPRRDEIITQFLKYSGIVYMPRRQREVGSWIIDGAPVAEGEGWQDWPAFHRVAATDRARIRVAVVPEGSQARKRADVRRLAEAEFRILSRLSHDALEIPRDLVDDEFGVGLVYRADDRFRRLDLWLAEHPDGIPIATQLTLVRQLAEAVQYAHRHRVVHRGLTPAAVLVRETKAGGVRVKVSDWNTLGLLPGGSSAGSSDSPFEANDQRDTAVSAALTQLRRAAGDADARFAGAFQAPEGVWSPDADRVRLDVFALGALAYYLVAGRPPAADAAALAERLRREKGLDVSVDVPQVLPALRDLVLAATRPMVTARLADVSTFLTSLAEVEEALARPDDLDDVDPLDAAPGKILGGRFRLVRRLGSGSTAVGLLVEDLGLPAQAEIDTDADLVEADPLTEQASAAPRRVLKVAVDGEASRRLADEAEVLRRISGARFVRLVDGPLVLGDRPPRQALLLDQAGEDTLADRLRGRARLSLDLLERWGGELLEAVVELERQGETHRDIKPSNLGIRTSAKYRSDHLVLFDFSSARADATALGVGTPPYLDPFLGEAGRDRFDSAAERYAAAVTLFEMATGSTPQYGDGVSAPNTITEPVTVEPAMFDPAVADALAGFFQRALARDARERHHTAGDMLETWKAVFHPVTPRPGGDDDAQRRAAQARPETPLSEAGLSPRALSALGQVGAVTVADLLAVDPWRLTRLAGVSDSTRREINTRVRAWRERFGSPTPATSELPDPRTAAALLVDQSGGARAEARRRVARLLLGLDDDLEAFATQGELASQLGVIRPRVTQHLIAMQSAWADDATCGALLDMLAGVALAALQSTGGVATVGELADAALAALPQSAEDAGGGPTNDAVGVDRIAAGLVRLALDRSALRERSGEAATLARRRRNGQVALLAQDVSLLDAAEAIGRQADKLVAGLAEAETPLVPAARAAAELRAVFTQVRDAWQPGTGTDPDDLRLVRLAAALSGHAAASGRGELHDRRLTHAGALRLVLSGVAAGASADAADDRSRGHKLTTQEIQDRYRVRFPALAPLPDRPQLDDLLAGVQPPWTYNQAVRAYVVAGGTSNQDKGSGSLRTRLRTRLTNIPQQVRDRGDQIGRRLGDSASSRSFLALGVVAQRLERAEQVLMEQFGATRVDVTGVLLDALHRNADEFGLPWDVVRAADAAAPGSRDAEGLTALVARALPAVTDAIEQAGAGAPEGTRPILVTESAPLARYGHLALLGHWTDLGLHRMQAVWLLVPQLGGASEPVVDGHPLPLASPGQFLMLDNEWLDGAAGGSEVSERVTR